MRPGPGLARRSARRADGPEQSRGFRPSQPGHGARGCAGPAGHGRRQCGIVRLGRFLHAAQRRGCAGDRLVGIDVEREARSQPTRQVAGGKRQHGRGQTRRRRGQRRGHELRLKRGRGFGRRRERSRHRRRAGLQCQLGGGWRRARTQAPPAGHPAESSRVGRRPGPYPAGRNELLRPPRRNGHRRFHTAVLRLRGHRLGGRRRIAPVALFAIGRSSPCQGHRFVRHPYALRPPRAPPRRHPEPYLTLTPPADSGTVQLKNLLGRGQ